MQCAAEVSIHFVVVVASVHTNTYLPGSWIVSVDVVVLVDMFTNIVLMLSVNYHDLWKMPTYELLTRQCNSWKMSKVTRYPLPSDNSTDVLFILSSSSFDITIF